MTRPRFISPLGLILFTATVGLGPTPASAVPAFLHGLSLSASYGPSLSVGRGSERFEGGRTLGIDLVQPRGGWVLRSSFVRFDRGAGTVDATSALQFFNGGRLYLPVSISSSDWSAGAVELGLRRSFGSGRLRANVEGLAGAGTVASQTSLPFRNDRRADPLLHRDYTTRIHDRLPTFTVGTGVEMMGPWRTAWLASVGTEWAPVRGLAGPRIPIRFGARWPADPAAAGDGSTARGPRLRLAAGANALRNPVGLRRQMDPGLCASAGIEIPFRRWAAVSIEGEHVVQDDQARLFREQMDEFGNLVRVDAGGSVPLSLTATVLTAGLRVRGPGRRAIPFVRAGAGWGRTGGFGYDVNVGGGGGAYLDPHGNWVPVSLSGLAKVAGGTPESGFGYSGTAGVEVRVFGSMHAFLEGGVLGLRQNGEDLLVTPLRLGVALQ